MEIRLINEYLYPEKSKWDKAVDLASYPLRTGLGGVKVFVRKGELRNKGEYSTVMKVAMLVATVVFFPVLIVSSIALVLKKLTMGELPVGIKIRSYLSEMNATLGKAKTWISTLSKVEDAPTVVLPKDPDEVMAPLASSNSPKNANRGIETYVNALPADLKKNWDEVENAFLVMERSLDMFVEELGAVMKKTELTDFDQKELVRHFSYGPTNFQRGLKMIVDAFSKQFVDHKELSKFVINRFFMIQVRASKIAENIVNLPVSQLP